MNTKILLARIAIGLAFASFITASIYGVDISVFAIFSAGCVVYALIALSFFRKNISGILSSAFFGSFVGMFLVLTVHTLFLVLTITLRGDWGFGWQFFLTLFGIIPVMITGAILGGIFEFIKKRFSIILAYSIVAIIIIALVAAFVLMNRQQTANMNTEFMHRNGQNADGTYACDTFLHEDYQLIRCYTEEAGTTGSSAKCISGIDRSLPGMRECLFAAANKSKNVSVCEYFANNPSLQAYLGYAPSYQDTDPQLSKQHRLVYAEDYKACLASANGK